MKGLRIDSNSIVRSDHSKWRYRLLADGSITDNERPGKIVAFITNTGELDRIFRVRSPIAKQRILQRIVEGV